MKAIVYHNYGSPHVLALRDVPKPVPKDDEVLINVRAASINSWDWDLVRGEPFIIRLWGLQKPKYTIPGADYAGTIEAVGKAVARFKPGDDVFGDLCENSFGAFAEYTCARENALTLKPSSMTFEQAAAIPQAGLMALQGLHDKGHIKAGQKILLNGAAGGVGTFALQIAKSMGTEVTCVDSTLKLEKLLALGADYVIDYTKEDFTRNGKGYDIIIDVVSNRSISEYKRSLNKGGIFVMIGGTMRSIFQGMFLSKILSGSDKKLTMLPYRANKGLDVMIELFESGKAVPVIDTAFPLAETSEAFRYYASGQFKGKVVIKMNYP